jgi:hypothetical protein
MERGLCVAGALLGTIVWVHWAWPAQLFPELFPFVDAVYLPPLLRNVAPTPAVVATSVATAMRVVLRVSDIGIRFQNHPQYKRVRQISLASSFVEVRPTVRIDPLRCEAVGQHVESSSAWAPLDHGAAMR